MMLVFAAPLLDWQVASHGKIPYPIGVMQQHVANWVECVARLSSVNPSVAVLSSVCSHLTGSKSVFVCLIVRSCEGVLCVFINARESVYVCSTITYKMGGCLRAHSLCYVPCPTVESYREQALSQPPSLYDSVQ